MYQASTGPPMTLGNMRSLGVGRLIGFSHSAVSNVVHGLYDQDRGPFIAMGERELKGFAERMRILCFGLYRRCPMLMSKANAFWRTAPSVRFIALEILATGVFYLECVLRSRTSFAVHATRLCRPLDFARRPAMVIPFFRYQSIAINYLNAMHAFYKGDTIWSTSTNVFSTTNRFRFLFKR